MFGHGDTDSLRCATHLLDDACTHACPWAGHAQAVTDTQMFGSFITSDDDGGHQDVARIVSGTSYHSEIYLLLAGSLRAATSRVLK